MQKDNTRCNFNDIHLSNKITIKRYRELEDGRRKSEIAQFIYERFSERYIAPFESMCREQKHGFSLMAVSCFMIEALESFRQGYLDTKGGDLSHKCFKNFFKKFTKTTNRRY